MTNPASLAAVTEKRIAEIRALDAAHQATCFDRDAKLEDFDCFAELHDLLAALDARGLELARVREALDVETKLRFDMYEASENQGRMLIAAEARLAQANEALKAIRNLSANWANSPDFNPMLTEVCEFANAAIALDPAAPASRSETVTDEATALIVGQLKADCNCEDNVDAEQEYDGSWRGRFSICTSCKAATFIRAQASALAEALTHERVKPMLEEAFRHGSEAETTADLGPTFVPGERWPYPEEYAARIISALTKGVTMSPGNPAREVIAALLVREVGLLNEDSLADDIIAALSVAGMVVVPREPTEAMNNAARDWSLYKYGKAIGREASEQCYRVMLGALSTPTLPPAGDEARDPRR